MISVFILPDQIAFHNYKEDLHIKIRAENNSYLVLEEIQSDDLKMHKVFNNIQEILGYPGISHYALWIAKGLRGLAPEHRRMMHKLFDIGEV